MGLRKGVGKREEEEGLRGEGWVQDFQRVKTEEKPNVAGHECPYKNLGSRKAYSKLQDHFLPSNDGDDDDDDECIVNLTHFKDEHKTKRQLKIGRNLCLPTSREGEGPRVWNVSLRCVNLGLHKSREARFLEMPLARAHYVKSREAKRLTTRLTFRYLKKKKTRE